MESDDGQTERELARQLSRALAERRQGLTRVAGLDLTSAFEQAVYASLRSGHEQHPGGVATRMPVPELAVIGRLMNVARRLTTRQPGTSDTPGILVVISAAIHARLLEPVAEVLAREHGLRTHVVLAPGVEVRDVSRFSSVSTLAQRLNTTWLQPLAMHAIRLILGTRVATRAWQLLDPMRGRELASLAPDMLSRLAVNAAFLDSAVTAVCPELLAAYDESGIWGRLVPEIARAHALPAADLPHAELADRWGASGISYDALAVYGPRSAAVLASAGIPTSSIVVTGAPRYDALIREFASRYRPWIEGRKVILVAAQPADTGARYHGPRDKALVIRSALAVAAALDGTHVIIKPHPTERDSITFDTLANTAVPAGISVEVDQERDLHDLLPRAFLMLTAYSQSSFEAAIVGIPTISVTASGSPFAAELAAEGIVLAASDEGSAVAAARAMLDDGQRRVQVARARAALAGRLGDLDGRATERTAGLLARLVEQGDAQRRRATSPAG
jgi:hypothetical protein